MSMRSLSNIRDDFVVDEQHEISMVSDKPEFTFVLPQPDNKPVQSYMIRFTNCYGKATTNNAQNILGVAIKSAQGYYKGTAHQSEVVQYLIPVDSNGTIQGQIYKGTDTTNFFNLGQISGLVQIGLFENSGLIQDQTGIIDQQWKSLDVATDGTGYTKCVNYDKFLIQFTIIIQYK